MPAPASTNEWELRKTLREIQKEIDSGFYRTNNKIEIHMEKLKDCVAYSLWD